MFYLLEGVSLKQVTNGDFQITYRLQVENDGVINENFNTFRIR
jgi:hypothetical protein